MNVGGITCTFFLLRDHVGLWATEHPESIREALGSQCWLWRMEGLPPPLKIPTCSQFHQFPKEGGAAIASAEAFSDQLL